MSKKLTPDIARPYLADCPEEKAFHFVGGAILRNIRQLHDALAAGTDDQYLHHHNGEKHDFYNWILFVIGDHRLANDLAHAKTRATAVRRLAARIAALQKITGAHA